MDVLICCDGAYLKGLVVTIESLLEHASAPCKVHLALEEVEQRVEDQLRQQWNGHPRLTFLKFHGLDHVPKCYRGVCHFSRAAFGKIALPPAVTNVDRLLVIDPDMLILHDVHKLADVDIDNFVVGLAGYGPFPLFNSGLLYVNLNNWRRRQLEKRLRESWIADPRVECAEQDLLQRVLQPDWVRWLDPRWNSNAELYGYADQAIVHFIGGRKPWHGDYGGPPALRQAFFERLDRTFLAGQREWRLIASLKRHWNKRRIRRQNPTSTDLGSTILPASQSPALNDTKAA